MIEKQISIKVLIVALIIIGTGGIASTGLMYMNYQNLDTAYAVLTNDYESGLLDYEELLDDYDELMGVYENQLTVYHALNESYTVLLEEQLTLLEMYEILLSDYYILTGEYNGLNNTYYDLLEQYVILQGEYDALQLEYDLLNNAYILLQDEYNILQAEYDVLLADYNTLQNEYDDLLVDYTTLDAQYNALFDDYVVLSDSHILLQTQYDDLYVVYTGIVDDYSVLWDDYVGLNDIYNVLVDEHNALLTAYSILESAYDTITTWVRQQILPMQYGVFAEAVRRYYFQDYYVNDTMEYDEFGSPIGFLNESGYWAEFTRFCRDIVLHDSNQKVEGTLLGQDSEFLVIPPEGYNPFVGIIDLNAFAWYQVDGIVIGDDVKIVVDFTNGDTDVMVFWADTDNSSWTFGDSLVGYEMTRALNPEIGSFVADRNGSIMIGIFDYDRELGIWAARVTTQFGLFVSVSNVLSDALLYGSDTETLAWDIMQRVLGYPWYYWGDWYGFLTGDYLYDIELLVWRAYSNIDYDYDSAITRLREPYNWDYIKFPVETAFRQAGDCEDQAILTAAFLESNGFETAMLIIHDDNHSVYGSLYHGALIVEIRNVTEFRVRYPSATIINMGYINPNWEWGMFIDTTWNTPFGTNPDWLEDYVLYHPLWNDVLQYWTIGFCDIDGFITYVPPGGTGTNVGIFMP